MRKIFQPVDLLLIKDFLIELSINQKKYYDYTKKNRHLALLKKIQNCSFNKSLLDFTALFFMLTIDHQKNINSFYNVQKYH
jgi:hypothetical protein